MTDAPKKHTCWNCGAGEAPPVPTPYDVLKTIQMELHQHTSWKDFQVRTGEAGLAGVFTYAGHYYEVTVTRKEL